MDCDYYGACLQFAAAKNWKDFHCTGCTYEGDQNSGPDSGDAEKAKVLCVECQKKETLGNSSFCASCMAIKGNKARAAKAKNKGTGKPEKAKKPQSKPKDRKPLKEANTALRIDFGKHAKILRQVEGLAEKQIRPVDLQVIYILKNHLEEMGDEYHEKGKEKS